jgi:hypothetical protein
MAHRKQAAWYSVTLNLGRILEVAPATRVIPRQQATGGPAMTACAPAQGVQYGHPR